MAMRSGSTTSLPGRAELTTLQGHAASVVAQKGEIWPLARRGHRDDNEIRAAVVAPGLLLETRVQGQGLGSRGSSSTEAEAEVPGPFIADTAASMVHMTRRRLLPALHLSSPTGWMND